METDKRHHLKNKQFRETKILEELVNHPLYPLYSEAVWRLRDFRCSFFGKNVNLWIPRAVLGREALAGRFRVSISTGRNIMAFII